VIAAFLFLLAVLPFCLLERVMGELVSPLSQSEPAPHNRGCRLAVLLPGHKRLKGPFLPQRPILTVVSSARKTREYTKTVPMLLFFLHSGRTYLKRLQAPPSSQLGSRRGARRATPRGERGRLGECCSGEETAKVPSSCTLFYPIGLPDDLY
jgi:hypothetical protein